MKAYKDPSFPSLCAIIILAFTCSSAGVAAGGEEDSAQKPRVSQFLVRLIGTRPGWPDNMTPEEMQVMQNHYYYLKDLVAEKKVILAGPCPEGRYGLIIVQCTSREEAVELMENEPSVKGGVHTYEMEPIHVSLLVDYQSPERYMKNPSNRLLRKEIVVNASLEEVWNAWTTVEGVTSFFAPEAHVTLFPGGSYEILFSPFSPEGTRGSEGCKVLTWLKPEIFCFDWSAPPSFGDLRKKYTRVTIQFEALDSERVRVVLSQQGWGQSEPWDKLFEYFDKAWAYVLSNLKKRFDQGPLDWTEGE